MVSRRAFALAITSLLTGFALPAQAADKLHLAIGQKGFWDSMVVPAGIEAGIFKKHNLEIQITWTAGGSETLQAAITGSTQYALTNGTTGVLAAYEKGAPVRIVSSEGRGTSDAFWYVKADSSIKSLKDAAGKTMAFSRPGSSTNFMATQLAKQAGTNIKLVAAGGLPATKTQVMSGQIDIGWAVPPFILDDIAAGRARIVARGAELTEFKNDSIRVNVANANFLKENPQAAKAFDAAYAESVDWIYANLDKFLAMYAKENNISIEVARAAHEFYPKENLVPYPVGGIASQMKEALDTKQLSKPLTEAQIKELVVAPMR
jgi:NitT/TauT family transport system substrate-binding protein